MALEKLEKLTIQVETGENKFNNVFEVLFNPNQISIQKAVVYLPNADKYRRLTRRPPQGQKGLDERALMASQRTSPRW